MTAFTSGDFYRLRTNPNGFAILIIFSLLLFQGVLFTDPLLAHKGRLDSVGCHYNEKDEIYECHQGPLMDRIFENQAEILKASEEIRDPDRKFFAAKVLSATDGDAILVLFLRSGDIREVRLAGIDSPEKGQEFGRAARLSILKMAFGKVVQIHIKGIDPLGRMVADVILSDGRSMNRELVRKGLSWWDSEGSNDTSIAELEAIARSEGIGLWQASSPVPPWKFRKNGLSFHQRRHTRCDKICA